MSPLIVLAVSFALLVGAWFFAVRQRPLTWGRLWRRVPAVVALLASSAAIVTYAVFWILLRRNETINRPFTELLGFVPFGSVLSYCAVIGCWFGNGKFRALLIPASLLVFVLWAAAAYGV